ncbi:HEPN domain-containing protein [Candidatus Pacearchaeota archaeon]|nr:HEPN domain-containing protein [Candidatus Pacearchaeota archaeon]
MNFEELLSEKKIERVEKQKVDFDKCEKDILSAEHNFNAGDYEWARTIAYNSILRAGIKLMAFLGYRAIGKEHHKNTFEFLGKIEIDEELAKYFNYIRIKRNEFIYRDIETASESEAKETIVKAKEFVLKIRTFVLEYKTGEK